MLQLTLPALRARSRTPRAPRRRREAERVRELEPLGQDDDKVFAEVERPRRFGQCATGTDACPFVGCKHHLYLDVNPDTGTIKLNFPDLEPWELEQTCALRVAMRRGELTLQEVADLLNLSRERVRQIEVRGLLKLRRSNSPEDFCDV